MLPERWCNSPKQQPELQRYATKENSSVLTPDGEQSSVQRDQFF
jgi:hypothetical protein